MRKKNRLVHGKGINDANYPVYITRVLDGKRKVLWSCPFYTKWKDIIRRCYSEAFIIKWPTYSGCTMVDAWHSFMTFRAWMVEQDWQGKHLDKDILFPGNKIYGPDTCVFVDHWVNTFLLEATSSRGELPIGVHFDKEYSKYKASCSSVKTGKNITIGRFKYPEEAHQAWLAFKLEQAYILAAEQTDPRVAKALIERYENYGKLNSRP